MVQNNCTMRTWLMVNLMKKMNAATVGACSNKYGRGSISLTWYKTRIESTIT